MIGRKCCGFDSKGLDGFETRPFLNDENALQR